MKEKKAIVIGAGIAGIAAAIRLRKAGYSVDVFDAAQVPGGKIKEYRWEGFRFDTGPSLFTLPSLVEELFRLCQKEPTDYFTYKKLQTVTRYFYEDGVVINSYTDPEAFALEAQKMANVPADKVRRFLKMQSKTYQLLAPIFLENPIHIFSRLLKISNLPALWHIVHPRFLLTLNSFNSYFFKNKYLVRLFNRYGTYNGSNPYVMPSLFNIISHLEHNVGAYLPNGGMRQVIDALHTLAIEEGVNLQMDSQVSLIEVVQNRATGIYIGDHKWQADVIVSNMDVNNTYEKLLPTVIPPRKYLDNEKSTSALIFHWAIKGNHDRLDVHNILFADDYKEEFIHLFDIKELYHDPTIYIYISSKAIIGDAPVGHENWFVMINTPHLGKISWTDALVSEIKKLMIKKIQKYTGVDVADMIMHEHCITPQDLADKTFSYQGSLYGGSSNTMMSAFLRHPNFGSVRNLFFAGGTVHPGGGIPLSLLSAKICVDIIEEGYNTENK